MYAYHLDRALFDEHGRPRNDTRPRWEQIVAAGILELIATGRPFDPAIAGLVEPKNVFSGGRWAVRNLVAMGTFAACAAGERPTSLLAEMWMSERLYGPDHFQGRSTNYANYDTLPREGALLLGGQAADEALRGLRRDIAWWCLGADPVGNVYLPCGRIYWHEGGEPYTPLHLQPIVATVLGLPILMKPGDQRWAWTGMGAAQPFAVEGERLVRALFTGDEVGALRSWHSRRETHPQFLALLSELRAPEGARWEIWAWVDGSHAGVVSGLRPYISGPNGMISAVSSMVRQVLPGHRKVQTVWRDDHSDARFTVGGPILVDGGDRIPIPSEDPSATVVLDHDCVTINGRRIQPVRTLPDLTPWTPSRPGLAGVQGGGMHVEPEAPTRKRPEAPQPTAETVDEAGLLRREALALRKHVKSARWTTVVDRLMAAAGLEP